MTNILFKSVAWCALLAVLFVTVMPIEYRPADIFDVDVDRLLASAAMAFLFTLAYPRQTLLVGVVMVAGAALIEMLQYLSASRHARVDDAIVKSAGAFLGVGCGWMANEFRRSLRRIRARQQHFEGRRESMNRRSEASSLSPSPSLASRMDAIETAMRELPVSSSMIRKIYFDPADGRLRICMANGQERIFEGVPEVEAMAIATAKSPGQYYLDRIRPNFRRIAA